jgi:WD40 repeat protein
MFIVTGSGDNTARIWDTETGECVHILQGHTAGHVRSVAISPDGMFIVTGSLDKTAKIWNAKTGECVHTLQGHRGPMISVAISPDGMFIVTGSTDKTSVIWPLYTAEQLYSLYLDQLILIAQIYTQAQSGAKLTLDKDQQEVYNTLEDDLQAAIKQYIVPFEEESE